MGEELGESSPQRRSQAAEASPAGASSNLAASSSQSYYPEGVWDAQCELPPEHVLFAKHCVNVCGLEAHYSIM
jgi:hypothetical protein